MLSDAAESFSDIFSTLIVIIGVKLANKEADKEHPYGHERLETVAAIILSGIIFAVGIGIGWSGILKILAAKDGELAAPGALALVAAAVTIIVKEGMHWYMRTVAKKNRFECASGRSMASAFRCAILDWNFCGYPRRTPWLSCS